MKLSHLKYYFLLIFAAAPVQNSILSQTLTSFDFLRIPLSARSASLGNSFLTIQNDPTIVFGNPGGLASIEQPSTSIGFVKSLLDVNLGFVSYAQLFEEIGWFGAGVTYINFGSFDKTDKFANSLGSFGAAEFAVLLGYGNRFNYLTYGGNIKFIYSYFDVYSASGIAFDVGAQYLVSSEQIIIGISALNLGTQLSSYGSDKENLPFDINFGVSKKLEHLPLTVMLNFHDLNNIGENKFSNFSFGGEFLLSPSFRARVGYNNANRKDWKIDDSAKLAGFSAGIGLTISSYLVDYGYTSLGLIGDMHRITLSSSF